MGSIFMSVQCIHVFCIILGPTALDPLIVSRFVLGQPVAVGSNCRSIRLLSGAVPLYAATIKLPHRTAYLCTCVCRDSTCDLTFVSLTPAPSTENSYRGHYSLVCVRVGNRCGGQMSVMVIFGGHVSGKVSNAQHVLCINAVAILLV